MTIDGDNAVSNQKFGIGVIGFYGLIKMKKTVCSENETDGMVFAKSAHDPCLLNRGETLDDDAQYLDYAGDCTERSSKLPNVHRSRSPQQNKELAMFDGNNLNSQHFESAAGAADEVSTVARPFEKQIGLVHLF